MRSLTFKLTLAFLLVCLIEAVLVGVLTRQATEREFGRYLREGACQDLIEEAVAYYEEFGKWEGFYEFMSPPARHQRGRTPPPRRPPPPRPRQSLPGSPPGENDPEFKGPPIPSPPFVMVDQQRQVLLPSGQYRFGDAVDEAMLADAFPVVAHGELVGRVFLTDNSRNLGPGEVRYLKRSRTALYYAAAGAVLIALLLSLFFARSFTRPLRLLTTATQAMARGDLKQEVPVQSQDELGALTASFNQMSADLAEANALRRQMTADIAHDLRTPLTVLSGYLEALREGTLPPSPERFETMYAEASQLNRLIDDLRTLSLADAGELTLYQSTVAPAALLDRTAASFARQAQEKDITLSVDTRPALPNVRVDFERMVQVLGNLVSNALRYTPAGGQITLGADAETEQVQLRVEDTGSGIPPEVLPRIFRRFYRADPARPKDQGESGLGLAIARSIVEAHGGTIGVESEEGRGTVFQIRLPVA